MAKDKVKFDIDNGPSFFADEVGVIHNPVKIILDFKSITPRVDVRNKEYQPLVLRHNVVIMDPYTAKSFMEVLEKNLANYEKEFGKIKEPPQLKKSKKKKKSTKTETPSYFG